MPPITRSTIITNSHGKCFCSGVETDFDFDASDGSELNAINIEKDDAQLGLVQSIGRLERPRKNGKSENARNLGCFAMVRQPRL